MRAEGKDLNSVDIEKTVISSIMNKKIKNKVLIESFILSINSNINSVYSELLGSLKSSSYEAFRHLVIDLTISIYEDALSRIYKNYVSGVSPENEENGIIENNQQEEDIESGMFDHRLTNHVDVTDYILKNKDK